MILSDITIPDHNPGDDVLQFNLRLSSGGDDGISGGDGGRRCFCLEGHACDTTRGGAYEGKRRKTVNRRYHSPVCATSKDSTLDSSTCSSCMTPAFIDTFYRLLLSPLTKWDSARFLSLAVDPAARMPKNIQNTPNEVQSGDDRFADSEQAHAFFPLFPLCIRYVALMLVRIAPSASLPSTFEGVTALSAVIINLICFVSAAISLYETTRLLLLRSLERLKEPEVEKAAFLVASLFLLQSSIGLLYCIVFGIRICCAHIWRSCLGIAGVLIVGSSALGTCNICQVQWNLFINMDSTAGHRPSGLCCSWAMDCICIC